MVQQPWWRGVTSPFPPSGNEGYIRNRDVPSQSVTPSYVGWPTNWDPYQKATDTAPSSVLWKPPAPLLFGAGQGFTRRPVTVAMALTHSVRLDNTGKTYPFHLEQECCGSPSFPKEVQKHLCIWTTVRCIWKIRGDCSLLAECLPGNMGSEAIPWTLPIWDPIRSLQDGAAMFGGRRPGRSAKTVLLFTFYLFLISLFAHITSALITYDKSTLLDIGNRFTNLVQDTLSPNPNPSWPLEILRNAENKGHRRRTRNTVEKALEFATDWGKELTVLLYRAFYSLMSNPWIIRWTILEPG